MPDAPQQPGRLKRELGVFHAVLLGLGSILGTGVFVSIGIAVGIAGPSVLIAIVLAALLALCNGLSSAQLAAAHPVAGGTYEYGYKFLHPKLGFTAGWMFLLAKSASAATAALGVSTYLIYAHVDAYAWDSMFMSRHQKSWIVGIATGSVLLVTGFVLCGLRRAVILNLILLIITFTGIAIFVGYSIGTQPMRYLDNTILVGDRTMPQTPSLFLMAVALMFVAFTGYGRIATLGEEVHHPKRTIPISIFVTLTICATLYLLVGLSLIRSLGTENIDWLINRSEVLFTWTLIKRGDVSQILIYVVLFAAITAMLGVLLNLVLGLSRVLLAMGRRHDVPGFFKNVNAAGTTPVPAVIGVGILIAGLTLIGDVKTTWTFSAFTVLVYYGITNLAALRLPKENRLYPRVFSWAGLGGCFFLCWWVEPIVWLIGLKLILLGLLWHALAPRMFGDPPLPTEVCAQCGYDLRASAERCPECGAAIPDALETAASPRGGES